MGEKVLELEPEDWQEMEARVSKLVEAIESLDRRIDYERHRINNLEAHRFPMNNLENLNIEQRLVELEKGKI